MRKSEFLSNLINETLEHGFFRLHAPFIFYSAKFRCTITMPILFVHDKESVPGIKGTNERAGVIHDGGSRIDFVSVCIVWDDGTEPVEFNKAQVAALYLEAMETRDNQMKELELQKNSGILPIAWCYVGVFNRWWRRPLKYSVVRIWPGYWHKFPVMATYEEITA